MRIRSKLPALVFALALACGQTAFAQHKCVTPDGRIAYSERPCVQEVRVNYYDVQGNDFNSLLGALNVRGTFHGRADWKLSYRFRSRMGPGGCGVTSFNTDLDLQMTLPRWTPPAGVPADLVTRWERYMAALRLHEEGHLDHGRGAEKEFRAVASATTASDCGSLDRALRDRFSKLIADYQARDRDYDRRTEHGKSQGAFFR